MVKNTKEDTKKVPQNKHQDAEANRDRGTLWGVPKRKLVTPVDNRQAGNTDA